MMRIDLNADVGEGAEWDVALMSLVTSVNIACGAHAGDEKTMARTMELAQARELNIGAHPGFADREGMGRRDKHLTSAEVIDLVSNQLAVLGKHGAFRYVKPHGALYTMAARDRIMADAVADAVIQFDSNLALMGLAGSELVEAGRARGLRVVREAFADRCYTATGQLVPRLQSGAMIEAEEDAVAQVLSIAQRQEIVLADETRVAVEAESICLHGDSQNAVAFARRLRSELGSSGVQVRAFLA
jgi:UPF0271 protein